MIIKFIKLNFNPLDKKNFLFLYLIWIFWGIYGLIWNITYVDETKYMMKGYLILKGEVSYYNNPDFLYQHMPFSLLWFGLGQKILGPSLFIARIQAFLTSLAIPFLIYKLASLIKNRQAGLIALLLLTLSPITILYYSSATPTSLIAFLFLAAFLCLYQKKYILTSLCFTSLFLVRENFIFTLIFYLGFLLLLLRKNLKDYFQNFILIFAILMIFLLPGYGEILDIIKLLPGLNYLSPVSSLEKAVLILRWQKEAFSPVVYLQALSQSWYIYQLWFLIGIFVVIFLRKISKKIKFEVKQLPFFNFLLLIVLFNFIAHLFAALQFSPRSIIGYIPYFSPLLIIILSVFIEKFLNYKFFIKNFFKIFIFLFLCFSLPALSKTSLFTFPFQKPDLIKTGQSAKELKKIFPQHKKILWLAEPISLYLAGGNTYSPLLNHINYYKPTDETQIVKSLGFWNNDLFQGWLQETDFVFIEPDKINFLALNPEGKKLIIYLENYLQDNFQLVKNFGNDFSPKGLLMFQRKKHLG